MSKFIIVSCPHCKDFIIINKDEFNCKIFRHGSYKKNGKQINPHMKKKDCDKLSKKKLINGCGKPFRLIEDGKKYNTEICDYI